MSIIPLYAAIAGPPCDLKSHLLFNPLPLLKLKCNRCLHKFFVMLYYGLN